MPKFPHKTIFLISPAPRNIEGMEHAWPYLKIFVNKVTPNLKKAEKAGAEIINLKLPRAKKTFELLSEMILRKLIRKGSRILVFKNLPKIKKLAQKYGLEVLMPESRYLNLLEDKINFVNFCRKFKLPILPTKTCKLNLVNFVKPIVIQTRRGHAGESTFFVRSSHELDKLKKKAGEWTVKITPLKKLSTFSLNLCATQEQVFSTQPFYQITGDANLNPLEGGTGGIDLGIAQKLSKKTLDAIFKLVNLTGKALQKIGYRGIAGIDFLVDDKNEKIYLLEMNPRLLSNLGFITKKQAEIKEVPLLTIHLLEMLGEDLGEWNLPEVSETKEGRLELAHPKARLIF